MNKVIDQLAIQQINAVESFPHRVLAAAVYYAEQGLYVIPIRPNGKAIPEKRDGLTYSHASKDPSTVASWFGPEGKYWGWNVGLACGAADGIFAIDVDKQDKNGFSGYDTLEAIEDDHGPLKAVMQKTPNGGRHYVYNWFESGSSSTAKIGRGIDTRGGNGECRSHIVAWPSEIDGEAYEWEDFGAISDAPEWVANLLGDPWDMQVSRGTGRGNENLDEDDTERLHTLREIWDLLQVINPDNLSYDDWLRVGQAIHSQHSDAGGLKVWDAWSQKGERYKDGECHARWSGFKSYGPVRIGTIYYHAKRYGYVPKPQLATEVDFSTKGEYDILIDELNKEYGIVVVGGKVRVISESINGDPDRDLTFMTLDDFKNLTMNKKIAIANNTGQTKAVPKTAIWLGDERRREFTGGVEFRPDKPSEFQTPSGLAYNLWRGWRVNPIKGNWSKLKAHIFEVICDSNDFYFEWILDWMADFYQDPSNPKGVAIVMKGDEGCGKGTFIEAMGRTIGRHYKHLTHDKHLTGDFNAHMQDALLVFADEVIYGGDKRHAGALKALVTEKLLLCERKGLDAYNYRNMSHVAMASNEDWFIPAGPQSRRWFVLKASNHRVKDNKWFRDIYSEMDNGGIEAMMYELMERGITNNLQRAPETELLQDQRDRYAASYRDTVVEWWADQLEAGTIGVLDYANMDVTGDNDRASWPSIVDRVSLFDNYEAWCIAKRREARTIFNKPMFYSRMESYGLKTTRPSANLFPDGKRVRVFEIPTLEEAEGRFKSITGREI